MAKAKVTFVDGMRFVGSADSGHAVVMDAPLSVGGGNTGPTPMELLLIAFGGCSGMDMVSILKKKRQDIDRVEILVEGKKAEQHPMKYTEIHISYAVTGRDVSEESVKRAVELSLEKYCSVGAMLGAASKITHSYKIFQL